MDAGGNSSKDELLLLFLGFLILQGAEILIKLFYKVGMEYFYSHIYHQ